MAKLTEGDYFHIHSLRETTLWFFAGYDTRVSPQLGKVKSYYYRAPLQCKHMLEVELFMLAVYMEAIHLQPHSSQYHIWCLCTQSRECASYNMLLNIFLTMVFCRFIDVIHKCRKKVQSHFKLIYWSRKSIYKLHSFWFLFIFHSAC